MKEVTFVNNNERGMDFWLGGEHYEVAPGATVEIPVKFLYAVDCMGLKLDRADDELKNKEVHPKAATEAGKVERKEDVKFVDVDSAKSKKKEKESVSF